MKIQKLTDILETLHLMLPGGPKEISKEVVIAWGRVLATSGMTDEEIMTAFDRFVPIAERFPRPVDILTMHQQGSTGSDTSALIEGAMRKWGYNNPEEAREYMGELGWAVVQRCGGWDAACSIESESMLMSTRKMWREVATSIAKNPNFRPQQDALPSDVEQKAVLVALSGGKI